MSLLTETFEMTGLNGKQIVFSQPYLTDEKELEFRNCSKFVHFPKLRFILNEERKALELRQEGMRTALILLTGNEAFLEKAKKAKDEIVKDVVSYSNTLKSGKEKIVVLSTGLEELPFYFTSNTILERGVYSIKFEKGLIHYLNLHVKKEFPFSDFMEIQKELSNKFAQANVDRFKVENQGDLHYEMQFSDLLKIA